MKIDFTAEIEKILPSKEVTPGDKGCANGQDFAQILKETLDRTDASQQQADQVFSSEAMVKAGFDPYFAVDKDMLVQQAEQLLDVFDTYQQRLADGNYNLRQIHPLVEEISKLNETLLSNLDNMPEGDQLKDILSRVAITAATEVIKFNRGDYVNP